MSRKTLGERYELTNEAAVQLYLHPIPSTILSLFAGRMTNLPEQLLHGTIGRSGPCEFTVSLYNGTMILCFIEFKDKLPLNASEHSDIVAQVIAEMDGADTFNKTQEFDGMKMQAILTDGLSYVFYQCTFKN